MSKRGFSDTFQESDFKPNISFYTQSIDQSALANCRTVKRVYCQVFQFKPFSHKEFKSIYIVYRKPLDTLNYVTCQLELLFDYKLLETMHLLRTNYYTVKYNAT